MQKRRTDKKLIMRNESPRNYSSNCIESPQK